MIPHAKGVSRALHRFLVVLAGFLALSAIPGGLALLFGFYAPPLEQLRGSVFADFTFPGLALLFLVGGGAVLAMALLLRRHRYAHLFAAFAGLMVMSFEFVEVLAIGSPPGPAQVMQILYFAIGLALVGGALAASTGGASNPSLQTPSPAAEGRARSSIGERSANDQGTTSL